MTNEPDDPADLGFVRQAIALARQHMQSYDGGPFGALIVRGSEIVGVGWNRVTSTNDPTAHAEVVAIRAAASRIGSFTLQGCVLYTSCEPCPMCLSAAYWSRLDRIVFAATRTDAADAGFDDEDLYAELSAPMSERRLPISQTLREEAVPVFEEWKVMPGKTPY